MAGTALQARIDGAKRAALIIHEFQGSKTTAPLLERNAADLAAFLMVLNEGKELEATVGRFAGPWSVRVGAGDGDVISVLVGKVVTRLGASSV